MKIRLDKYLANMGVGSRKEVKDYIKKGLVKVNGEIQTLAKLNIDTEDEISLNNEILTYQEYVYFMMNKPEDTISATKDRRRTVIDLLDEKDQKRSVFPVGRLDKDTTGLLLLTDDGRLAHDLLSPKNDIEKVYEAQLDQKLDPKDVEAFQEGFYLKPENILTKPAKLEILEEKRARVSIVEGKYHQVKRMFAQCGKEVLALKRLAMGSLVLDENLEIGTYRELTQEEIDSLKDLAQS